MIGRHESRLSGIYITKGAWKGTGGGKKKKNMMKSKNPGEKGTEHDEKLSFFFVFLANFSMSLVVWQIVKKNSPHQFSFSLFPHGANIAFRSTHTFYFHCVIEENVSEKKNTWKKKEKKKSNLSNLSNGLKVFFFSQLYT